MAQTSNPLETPSTLPYDLPPFAQIRPEHFLPAFERAFDEQRGEINAITYVRSMPTFENTVVALERSGRQLDALAHTFYTISAADATPEYQALEETLAPRMTAHTDAIALNSALYARIRALHDHVDELGLDDEQRYLLERHFREMTLAGAPLDDETKERLKAINERLSALSTTFEKRLLADSNALALVIDDAAELDGLASGELSAAAQAAADSGRPGGYELGLTLYTGHPYLSSLTHRETRRKLMDASRSRGRRGGENDNREVLLEIVRLRAERAELLGYPNHAAAVTADETAGTPEAVHALLRQLAVQIGRAHV